LKPSLPNSCRQIILYFLGAAIYNTWFHPLSKYPGPRFAGISAIPYARALIGGRLAHWTREQHEKHGEIIRIAPNSLSFTGENAWKDIYGHRQGHKQFIKANPLRPINDTHSIVSTPSDPDHSRMRRLLSHAFSEKALHEQESLIQSYVDTLIGKLREQPGPVDIVKWLNYTTFDIIADLSFGEPFWCLRETQYHPWVSSTFRGIKAGIIMSAAKWFPPFERVIQMLIPPSMKAIRRENFDYTCEKVTRRMELGPGGRPDFMSYILRHNDEKGMSRAEIDSTTTVLFAAGSETTATLLSGLTYYLLQNPRTMHKLTDEIRTAFKSQEEITILSVSKLPYLLAVLEETLRHYPPAPSAFERLVPGDGDTVCGHWIPGGVSFPYLLSPHPSMLLPKS
jgi:cytochrome P450